MLVPELKSCCLTLLQIIRNTAFCISFHKAVFIPKHNKYAEHSTLPFLKKIGEGTHDRKQGKRSLLRELWQRAPSTLYCCVLRQADTRTNHQPTCYRGGGGRRYTWRDGCAPGRGKQWSDQPAPTTNRGMLITNTHDDGGCSPGRGKQWSDQPAPTTTRGIHITVSFIRSTKREAMHLSPLLKHSSSPLELIPDGGVENTEDTSRRHDPHEGHAPSDNSIVERINKDVFRHFQHMVYDKRFRDSWSGALPLVQWILDAEKRTETGVAPCEINFEAVASIDPLILRLFSQKDLFEQRSLSTWSTNMLETQNLVSDVARDTLMANARYSPRHQQSSALTVFPVGSLVWKLYNKPDEHIGRTTPKLHVIWKGPYRVLNISEDNTEYHWVHALSRTYVYSLIKLLIEYLSEEENSRLCSCTLSRWPSKD